MAKMNIKNRTIFCRDNIEVLQGINSDSVDLIYLDPPFNKKKVFTAPIGSSAEGASFRDYFQREDLKDEWVKTIEEDNEKLHNFLAGIKNSDGKNSYNYCYLCYMAVRVVECRRVLKDTGSIYLHCDPTMSHYLKIMLDFIFGDKNFRNEIVWNYGKWTNISKSFQKNHDILLFYSKSGNYTFNPLYVDKRSNVPYHTNVINGQGQLLVYDEANVPATVIEKYKKKNYRIVHVKRQQVVENDTWTYARFKELNILNSQSGERTGYPTQKPLALLDRIIRAGSRKGDVVLDPFCGCATTCIAAEKLGRQWVGIDVSVMAYDLVKQRAAKEIQKDLWDEKTVNFSTTPPVRTDRGRDAVERKFVYVISNPQYQGYYKVGVAANAQNRLNSYQTGDPARKYQLEFSLKMSNYRETEKHIHQTFENNHEWVRANLADIIRAIKTHAKK